MSHPDRIAALVCEHFGVTMPQIVGLHRTHALTMPRQVLCYLWRQHANMALAEIGRRIKRDHTTVIYHVRRVQEAMGKEDAPLARQVMALVEEIENSMAGWHGIGVVPAL